MTIVGPTLDLPPMDVAGRIPRLRESDAFAPLDALLVTRLPNIRYLCASTGSAGMLLITGDGVMFVLRRSLRGTGCESNWARSASTPASRSAPPAALQRELLHDAIPDGARLGLEAHGVTWAQQRTFSTEWFSQAELVPTEGVVEQLRRVKEPAEVARIRTACAIADDALREVTARLGDAPTEQEARCAWSSRCASAARVATASADRRVRSQRCEATRAPDRAPHPGRRAHRARLRLRRRGVLLRHDPHGERRRPRVRCPSPLGRRAPRANGPGARDQGRCGPAPTSTGRAGRSSRRPASANDSCTRRARGGSRDPRRPASGRNCA